MTTPVWTWKTSSTRSRYPIFDYQTRTVTSPGDACQDGAAVLQSQQQQAAAWVARMFGADALRGEGWAECARTALPATHGLLPPVLHTEWSHVEPSGELHRAWVSRADGVRVFTTVPLELVEAVDIAAVVQDKAAYLQYFLHHAHGEPMIEPRPTVCMQDCVHLMARGVPLERVLATGFWQAEGVNAAKDCAMLDTLLRMPKSAWFTEPNVQKVHDTLQLQEEKDVWMAWFFLRRDRVLKARCPGDRLYLQPTARDTYPRALLSAYPDAQFYSPATWGAMSKVFSWLKRFHSTEAPPPLVFVVTSAAQAVRVEAHPEAVGDGQRYLFAVVCSNMDIPMHLEVFDYHGGTYIHVDAFQCGSEAFIDDFAILRLFQPDVLEALQATAHIPETANYLTAILDTR